MFDSDSLFSEGFRNSISLVATKRNPRSAFKVVSTPGFRTLITTSFPFLSFALCTWAMDAVARGTGLTYSKTLDIGLFNSCCIILLISEYGILGELSKHDWNSSTYSAGNSVGELAINCPSLIYVAPNSSNSRFNDFAGEILPDASWKVLGLDKNSSNSLFVAFATCVLRWKPMEVVLVFLVVVRRVMVPLSKPVVVTIFNTSANNVRSSSKRDGDVNDEKENDENGDVDDDDEEEDDDDDDENDENGDDDDDAMITWLDLMFLWNL